MYGTASLRIVKNGYNHPKFGGDESTNSNVLLHDEIDILESEVYYAMDHELAVRPDDVLNRRLGLAFQNQKVATEVSQKVVDIMAKHLKWSSSKKSKELQRLKERIEII